MRRNRGSKIGSRESSMHSLIRKIIINKVLRRWMHLYKRLNNLFGIKYKDWLERMNHSKESLLGIRNCIGNYMLNMHNHYRIRNPLQCLNIWLSNKKHYQTSSSQQRYPTNQSHLSPSSTLKSKVSRWKVSASR